jgi:para-nitrobenzyl esterase
MTTIKTRLGDIRGIVCHGIQSFKGIRFGAPTDGEGRFRAPEPAGPWKGTLDATKFGNRAWAPPSPEAFGPMVGDFSHDCLMLNVWTPDVSTGSRPVLVWIHGGSFETGSGNDSDGTAMALTHDVVVVSINYRLGYEGFFDLSDYGPEYEGSGLNGIRDQVLGLEWVRDNIVDYGGDPHCVTIFGESAGGQSVAMLLATPAADGLYHRAIAHSAGWGAREDLTLPFSEYLGVEKDQLLARMLTMSGEELTQAKAASGCNLVSGPDGVVVTRSAWAALAERKAAGVPVIAGYNKDEGTLFSTLVGIDPEMFVSLTLGGVVPMVNPDVESYLGGMAGLFPHLAADPVKLAEAVWTDMFRSATTTLARSASQAGPGGWLYRFEYPSKLYDGKLGATHASEIAFTWNNFAIEGAQTPFYEASDPVAKELAQQWSTAIVQFARTGNPNHGGLPHWPQAGAKGRPVLKLNAECSVEERLDAAHEPLWGPQFRD